MIITVCHQDVNYSCNLSDPLDISIPMGQVRCFFAPPIEVNPYVSAEFIGSVQAGAPVNFYNIKLNPHGNGTHTEGLGHITLRREILDDCLKSYHFIVKIISVDFDKLDNGDKVITKAAIATACADSKVEALIIRTMPNPATKCYRDYSGTNPPYLSTDAMKYIVGIEVKHLLLDLPSVDREKDEGRLINHRLFWQVSDKEATSISRNNCTITELIYVPNDIADGLYLLNLQVPSINLDAVPSKPILYRLYQKHGK